MTLISKMRIDIQRQLTVQVASAMILSSLQISNSIIEVNFDDLKHSYIVNSLLNARDIYNVKTIMRRDALKSLTSVQVFIRELDQDD